MFGGKGCRQIKVFVILGHAHKIAKVWAGGTLKTVKGFFRECPGDLFGPVGPEVEKNKAISFFNFSFIAWAKVYRFDEFIGFFPVVGGLYGLDR